MNFDRNQGQCIPNQVNITQNSEILQPFWMPVNFSEKTDQDTKFNTVQLIPIILKKNQKTFITFNLPLSGHIERGRLCLKSKLN